MECAASKDVHVIALVKRQSALCGDAYEFDYKSTEVQKGPVDTSAAIRPRWHGKKADVRSCRCFCRSDKLLRLCLDNAERGGTQRFV